MKKDIATPIGIVLVVFSFYYLTGALCTKRGENNLHDILVNLSF